MSTGDMFRQAVLTVSAGDARERAVMQRSFASQITDEGERHVLRQVHDNRVPAPGAGPARRFQLVLHEERAVEVS